MKFTTTVQGEGRMAYFEVDDTDMRHALGDSVWTGLPINRKAMVMSGMGDAPSSRRLFQMSQTATGSKFNSRASLKNDGINASRARSPGPTMATRTRSFAPRILA